MHRWRYFCYWKPCFKSIRDSKSRSSVTDCLSPQSLEFCRFLRSSLNQKISRLSLISMPFNSYCMSRTVGLIRQKLYLFRSGIHFEIRGIDSHIFEEQKLSVSPSIITCLTSIDTGNVQTRNNCCWNWISIRSVTTFNKSNFGNSLK